MPDMISPILRRSFAFRAIPRDPSTHPAYDYAMGLAGSQAMYMVLDESAAELADPLRDDAPIRGTIVQDTDYTIEYVEPKKPAAPVAESQTITPADVGTLPPLAPPGEPTHRSPSQ